VEEGVGKQNNATGLVFNSVNDSEMLSCVACPYVLTDDNGGQDNEDNCHYYYIRSEDHMELRRSVQNNRLASRSSMLQFSYPPLFRWDRDNQAVQEN